MKKNLFFFFASFCFLSQAFGQGRALHFDGIDDFVSIPEKAGVLTGSAFTMEFWVKPDVISDVEMVVEKYSSAQQSGLLMYFYPVGPTASLEVEFYSVSGDTYLSHTIAGGWTTAWHHVALTYDGNLVQLLVDGTPVAAQPASGSLALNGKEVRLGVWQGSYFNGTLDELRFWNVARTQGQLQASMNTELPSGTGQLTGYYKFNQGTAGGTNTSISTVIDAVGNNHGVLQNFARTGPTSNFTSGYGSISVLSVRDGSFNATRKGAVVDLFWEANESGANRFTVEKSPDGILFTELATVTGTQRHQFTDATPYAGNNYYRIKSFDADGRPSYTKTVAVAMNNPFLGLQAFPNPATTLLQLQLTVPKGGVVLELRDVSGRLLQKRSVYSTGTTLSLVLDISPLARGIYFICAGQQSLSLLKQ